MRMTQLEWSFRQKLQLKLGFPSRGAYYPVSPYLPSNSPTTRRESHICNLNFSQLLNDRLHHSQLTSNEEIKQMLIREFSRYAAFTALRLHFFFFKIMFASNQTTDRHQKARDYNSRAEAEFITILLFNELCKSWRIFSTHCVSL